MFLENQILKDTYQIIRPIGSGGTSSVYLGYHLGLRKYVVIKQLRGSFSEDFMLRIEVDILKNLHHPNLPQVYDFIRQQDSVYTVIDFVDGYDLEAYIRSGTQFPEEQLKHYLRQIADVLMYLHGQNPMVIHSDIKPGNIMINQEGNAVLIDFNISLGGSWNNILGLTLPYASPEQIDLAQYASYQQIPPYELDGRTDIFSLGATFYELICGIRPTPGVPPTPLRNMGLTQYSKEFLALIDRMIEYDREKRIPSAKKLAAMLDRMDSRYRTYFTMRCASLLLSAVLVSGGIYCYITGTRQAARESYQTQIAAVTQCVTSGYLDQAEQICDEMLSDSQIQSLMKNDASAYAQLNHALGDIYYYREEYATAASYYDAALRGCDASDPAQMAVYLRDAAIAFAQNGNLDSARSLLEQAKAGQATSSDLLLVEIVLCARTGQIDQCIENTRKLLETCNQPELCMRAAMCAASVSGDPDEKIGWLEQATSFGGGRTVSRGLAVTYAEKAQTAATNGERLTALEKAAQLYAQLNNSDYASVEDRLNYSVVLSMQGSPEQAVSVLEEALEDYPGHYRVLTNLALTCNEMGDSTRASVYCAQAVAAWRADTSPDKLSESSDEIQNLLELARRFGIE